MCKITKEKCEKVYGGAVELGGMVFKFWCIIPKIIHDNDEMNDNDETKDNDENTKMSTHQLFYLNSS